MAKHTSGPWAYKHGDICGPDDSDGDDLVIAAVGASYGLRSATYSIVRKGPEMEANARLMTAAPDLLEALQEVADFIQPFNHASDLLDRIEAAIAKATA